MTENRRAGRPTVAEIVGPAGAGKTTLVEALRRGDPTISFDPRVTRAEQVPCLVRTVVRFGPAFLRRNGRDRWFTAAEMRAMAYLEVWCRRVSEATADDHAALIFDHGPIYRLVTLRWFGPAITRSDPYRRWWSSMLDRWARTLDLVVSLDAPSAILARRIHARERDHVVKGQSQEEVYRFLVRYREGFEQVAAAVTRAGGPRVLRFDTERESAERIAEAVCAELSPAAGRPAPIVAGR